jgi:hypothetical protein
MRCILGFCLVLAVATSAWAQNTAPMQQPFSGLPTGQPTAPVANLPTTYGNTVTAQPGATTMAPVGTTPSYYYYPAGRNGRMFRINAPMTVNSTNPTPVYTAPAQYYYTTVRRGPFGLFRRRIAQPVYSTAADTTTPTYYTTPGNYYTTPTNTTVPASTPVANPAYSPTSYTVPNAVTPAGTAVPSATTGPGSTISVPTPVIKP